MTAVATERFPDRRQREDVTGMLRGRPLHEEAVRLHEEHAEHARKLGDEATARKAEERAERARVRARLSPPSGPLIEWREAKG